MNRFCHYELRTTDVDAARAFYSDLLGARFWEDSISVGELPAQAAARGAPPHWLGHIGVDDVVGTMLRFVQSGATQLGPAARTENDAGAILRDPFGAIVALTSTRPAPTADRVVWHLLSARDEALAFAMYAELFGWTSLEALDLGPERGRHVTFTWDGSTQTRFNKSGPGLTRAKVFRFTHSTVPPEADRHHRSDASAAELLEVLVRTGKWLRGLQRQNLAGAPEARHAAMREAHREGDRIPASQPAHPRRTPVPGRCARDRRAGDSVTVTAGREASS